MVKSHPYEFILEHSEYILSLTDYKIGSYILGVIVTALAEDAGIPAEEISEEFGVWVIEHVSGHEASSARLLPLDKALHIATSGDFESAGKSIREHLARGAAQLELVSIGTEKSRQASDFGRRGAESNRSIGAANRQNVHDAAIRKLASRTRKPSDRSLAPSIARETDLSEPTVRRHLSALRKAGKLD